MSAGFTERDWEAWANEDAGPDVPPAPAAAPPQAASAAPAAPPKASRRGLVRLAVGSLAFGLLAALAAMLPSALPGELPADALAARDAPPCATCPPSGRIERLGAFEDGSLLRVNVVLGAAPAAAALTLELDGLSGTPVFRRTADGAWRVTAPAAFPADRFYVAERGPLVVLSLPAGQIRGVAVRSEGDRVPSAGYAAPRPPPARGAGLVDVLVLAVLLAAAAIGWRLGLAVAVGDALALVVVVLVTAVLWRPLASLLQGAARSGSASGALAVGLLVAAIGFAAGLMTRPLVPLLSRLQTSATSGLSRALAATLAALRALVVVATLLAVVEGLAAFGRLGPDLRASVLAGPLADAVRRFFS